jgi:hypothetical protein
MALRVWLPVLIAAGAACSTPAERNSASATKSQDAEVSAAPAQPSLVTGLGSHHHTIATSNPEAQRFFDQGFVLVFAFNHEEAVRSFQRAAALDPMAAMPQ